MSACRSCGAPIIWATSTETGKRMPVDEAPDPERGNVLLVSGNDGPETVVLTRAAIAARPNRNRLHTSHFATCSDAKGWRR